MMFDKSKLADRGQASPKLGGNRAIHQSGNALTVASFSSKKEKKFGAMSKLKIMKDNKLEGKVKYKTAQLEAREKLTASETFKADLHKGIGSGKVKINSGIAKRKATAENESAFNLGLSEDNPRMLARQIASWKVARNLNLRVLSNEKYGLDDNGEILGISALLPDTARSVADVLSEQQQIMDSAGLSADQKQNYLGNTIFSGKIQKELSDLQLLDALTGQTDRHSGNIFIDIVNQTVHGIDNDQAFGSRNLKLNDNNAIGSFLIHANRPQPKTSRYTYDETRGIEFTQSQIDANTAEKVLAMSESDLEELLKDKVGEAYGESLNDSEIAMSKVRLAAIKRQILQLKSANKLIKTWDGNTYNDAVTAGLTQLHEHVVIDTSFKNQKYQSYVAREVNKYAHGKNQFGGEKPSN